MKIPSITVRGSTPVVMLKASVSDSNAHELGEVCNPVGLCCLGSIVLATSNLFATHHTSRCFRSKWHVVFWTNSELPTTKLRNCTWKLMVGRQTFPFWGSLPGVSCSFQGALDHGTEALQAYGKKAELQADGSRYIDRFFVWDEPIFSLGCFGGTWGEFIEMTYSTLQETNIFFWKSMVGILISLWGGLFVRAMLVVGSVIYRFVVILVQETMFSRSCLRLWSIFFLRNCEKPSTRQSTTNSKRNDGICNLHIAHINIHEKYQLLRHSSKGIWW